MVQTPEEKAAAKAAREAKKAAEKAAAEAAVALAPAATTGAAGAIPATPAPVASATTDPITVKYRDHRGETVERTFSKDVHGDDFGALAAEFKATNASRLVTE